MSLIIITCIYQEANLFDIHCGIINVYYVLQQGNLTDRM